MAKKRKANEEGPEERAEAKIREGTREGMLNLSALGIGALPDSVRSLTGLQDLQLHNNRLRELPHWVGELSKLENLNLSFNPLGGLPPEIADLKGLRGLYADSCRLRSLPDGLDRLPLDSLYIPGNPELGIPESLLARWDQPQEILRYYYESRAEEGRPLRELKLLLVGRGKSGKTTLVKRLRGEEPDRNEPETHSINIRELALECPRGTVRTRIWDFGGQEILHSTHQFFLTERSLYLVVLEPRTGSHHKDADYWLRLIETQAGGSPTIVVTNYSRNNPWGVDRVKLERKFPFIVDFVGTDALHGDGVKALRETMARAVDERMDDVWLPFPGRWRAIKDEVVGMEDNFLTYPAFRKLCAEHGETDEAAQADLAGILHTLGLALHFGKEPGLSDTRVLNPGWVTGGVYAVIRSPSVRARDGQLSVRHMARVLNEAEEENLLRVDDYPSETRRFILELMREFDLAYASEVKPGRPGEPLPAPARYLVPQLLPEFEPRMPEAWGEAPVRLRYRYEVLPPALMPFFIVRTHGLSEDAPHWRHGVVLRHGEASALIRAESDRLLSVSVLGDDDETRRVLVGMVRSELDALHKEMKVQPFEDLALAGDGDRWISVKSLLEFEEPRKKVHKLSVLPEGTAQVNVHRELDKLLPAAARAVDRNRKKAPAPVRLFVSYSHANERKLKRLDSMLAVLELQHGLSAWRDQERLIAGDKWDAEIRRRLEEMDIFLFIASQFSLPSKYIRNTELPVAERRHKNGEIEVAVVKLEACACEGDPFLGPLQRLAPKHEPIGEKSTAWDEVRKDLLPVIARARKRKT